jgi:very-short-patch-repair endonuclease
MWRLLYPFRIDGYHFRKQVPIGPYYADIACHHAKLVIELDGVTHGTDAEFRHDATRDSFLGREGYTVLRFWNADVLDNPEGVFDTISRAIEGRLKSQRARKRSTPSPTLPTRGRVQAGVLDESVPQAPPGTSPLVGEAGRGVATTAERKTSEASSE